MALSDAQCNARHESGQCIPGFLLILTNFTLLQVNYHPSQQYDIDDNAASKSHGTAWTSPNASGPRVKQGIEKENNFQQPGEYYRSFDRESKDVFQKHLLTFMTHPKCSEAVQKTWIGFMHKVGKHAC